MEWALQSMKDFDYQEIVIASNLHELVTAVQKPSDWPRFRLVLLRISGICAHFDAMAIETESSASNLIAREIANSVFPDSRFHSYLALGGPAWLHQQIFREASLLYS